MILNIIFYRAIKKLSNDLCPLPHLTMDVRSGKVSEALRHLQIVAKQNKMVIVKSILFKKIEIKCNVISYSCANVLASTEMFYKNNKLSNALECNYLLPEQPKPVAALAFTLQKLMS